MLMLATAYSPHINPLEHSRLACAGLTFPIFCILNFCFLLLWLVLRSRLILLPLLGYLFCLSQLWLYCPFNFSSDKRPQDAIKFLSYNVMGFADLKRTADYNPVLDYLRNSEADIICIQEYNEGAGKHAAKKNILSAMQGYPYQKVHRVGDGHSSNRVACFSKYPIISAKRVSYESRNNGTIAYEIVVEKDTLLVINNHLESNKLTDTDKSLYTGMLRNPEAEKVKEGALFLLHKLAEAQRIRAKQAQAVHEFVKSSKHSNIIVCGDFNDSPISYTHRAIVEGLTDVYARSACGPGISYNQNKFFFRIDHLMVSQQIQPFYCEVDRSVKGSDHYPIWAYLRLGK